MKRPAFAFAAAALGLSLASCWAPYYDPEVSASAGLSEKLGDPIISFGPISGSGMYDSGGGAFEFLPSRPSGNPASPADGFLVLLGEDYARIAFVRRGDGGYSLSSGNQGNPNHFGSGAALRSEAESPGGQPQLVAVTDHSKVAQYVYDRTSRNLSQSQLPNASSSCDRVYAAGAVLQSGASDTDGWAILFSGGSQLYLSASMAGPSLGAFSTQSAISSGGRNLPSGGSLLASPGGGYIYYSDDGGPTLRWNAADLPSGAPAELPISRRLRAVLSDGSLLAQDDLRLAAYTAEGAELFAILAGSIRFQHEVYSPGPEPSAGYYLIFSQVLVQGSTNSDNRTFSVRVWRISLADFKKLG